MVLNFKWICSEVVKYLPSSELPPSEPRVYSDRLEALALLKRFKTGRFRAFPTQVCSLLGPLTA